MQEYQRLGRILAVVAVAMVAAIFAATFESSGLFITALIVNGTLGMVVASIYLFVMAWRSEQGSRKSNVLRVSKYIVCFLVCWTLGILILELSRS